MTDHTLHGMQDAETRHGNSSALTPLEIISAVDEIRSRPPVPHQPRTIEITANENSAPEPLVTMPMKRAAVGFLFVSAIGTGHALVVANGAAIVAIVAPWIGGGFGLLCLGFLLSALGGVVSGSGGGKSAGAKHETHYHYHQYNNQGHGSQNNGV